MVNMALRLATAAILTLPFLTSALPAPDASASPAPPTATLASGPIYGTSTAVPSSSSSSSSGATIVVNKFLGIPYASPPQRFAPPEPPAPWTAPLDATAYRPACIQQFPYPAERHRPEELLFNTPPPLAGESEDCLSLNVFTPAAASDSDGGGWGDWADHHGHGGSAAGLPVMFWIHGGVLEFGSGSLPGYDAAYLAAAHGVVVVTINYRMNVFGFPGAPQLAMGENNLGWLDQRLALQWVQQNIGAFGGDRDRVTIFGQSAGAWSVDALVTTPPEDGGFWAAIMESGQSTVRIWDLKESAASWKNLSAAVGCGGQDGEGELACMRAVPAAKLKDVEEKLALSFTPLPDGVTLAKDARGERLASTAQKSEIARVPVLIGTVAQEGRVYSYGQNDTAAYIAALLPGATKEQVAAVVASYDETGQTPFEQLGQAITDFRYQCVAALVASESEQVGIPTWRYYFNASFPNTVEFPDSGVYHSIEVNSIFGTYPRVNATAWQEEVSRQMGKTWTDFAKNPMGGPGWSEVPALGVLGGGARAENPADASGRGKEFLKVIAAKDVDGRCQIWDPLYEKVAPPKM